MTSYFSKRWLTTVLLLLVAAHAAADPDPQLPVFLVPGHQAQMDTLGELFALHHSPRTICTLWDPWIPMSTLWPALGDEPTAQAMRSHYFASLSTRQIDDEGYVTMNQHRGLAHPGGWPFPTWTQAGGFGHHFSHAGQPYRRMLRVPLRTTLDGWDTQGLGEVVIDEALGGLLFTTTAPTTSLTTPAMQLSVGVAPFIVIEWSSDRLAEGASPRLYWTTADAPEFDDERFVEVPLQTNVGAQYGSPLKISVVRMHDHPGWAGTITRLRLVWDNAEPAEMVFREIYSACDSRHPITNTNFIRGCYDYARWTGNVAFLQDNIERMRTALAYALDEFDVAELGRVRVPWVGHDGRTGFDHDGPGGAFRLHPGRGIGNNYWDLMPFGHDDCYATLCLYEALRVMAQVERAVAAHPGWDIAPPDDARLHADALVALADDVKARAGALFWNLDTERFVGSIDINNVAHDYGFTFVNLEGIYYGLANENQARSIMDWIDGQRIIESDTSTGADIYHWRFGPRATTKRNVQWYQWVWHRPESIQWGYQIQDGGAVLGFSYYDIMARLRVNGPDDAWQRLSTIIDWFAEVQAEGGYRAYYAADRSRGSLQGGGTAGGLGLDREFMESVMVPQVMLYGFLGLQPTLEGFSIQPSLPTDWPSLTVTRVAMRDHVLDVFVDRLNITLTARVGGNEPFTVELPTGMRPARDQAGVERAAGRGNRWRVDAMRSGDRLLFIAADR